MQTKNQVPGYTFSNGTAGKKWTRGRTMFSVGKQWTGNNSYIRCIIKTNLDTHEMTVASLKEHKRFLTDEAYQKYAAGEREEIKLGY